MRRLACHVCLALGPLLAPVAASAAWVDAGAGLTGVETAASAWGDYDGDGDLDLVMAGLTMSDNPLARIYRNDGGSFVPTSALPAEVAVAQAALAWGDYDGDGDLDLALAGDDGATAVTRVLRNDAGTFVDLAAGLQGIQSGDLAWGDYDNDGDLDLAISGLSGTTPHTKLYRNDAATFTEVAAGLTPVSGSALAWGDYDEDGDADLVVSGLSGSTPTTTLYRNTGGAFTAVATTLPGLHNGSAAWGDCDNDGDLDLLINGRTAATGPTAVTRVYRNTAGSFADAAASLQGIYHGEAVWGDFDNDGDLDIALAGTAASAAVTILYRNNGATFSNISAGMSSVGLATVAFGDHDGDGDLDLAMAGINLSTPIARVYRNQDATAANTPPTPPSGLTLTNDGTTLTFAWNASGDAQGGSAGLEYNLRVGTSPGAHDRVPALARSDGWRRVARGGNVGQRREWSMPVAALGPGNLYWSVQAIDQAFAGSAFAAEQTVGVEDAAAATTALRLEGANPFRGEARLLYALERAERVAVDVHDVTGRRVRSLARGMLPAGTSRLIWRGDDDRGRACPAGIYLVHVRGKGVSASLRIAKLE